MSEVPLSIQEGHAEPWRLWFAWHPVWVRAPESPYPRERRFWLCWIERRRFHRAAWFMPTVFDTSFLQYRLEPGQ